MNQFFYENIQKKCIFNEKNAFFALFESIFVDFSIFFCTFVALNECTRDKYKRKAFFLGPTKGDGDHQCHDR